MPDPVLAISNASIDFPKAYGQIGLVRDITLNINAHECVGLVGESGSGKSLLGLSIVGLLPGSAELRGRIALRGRNLVGLSERALRPLRGRELSIVYQDALVSLNPGMRIKHQLAQAIRDGGTRSAEELLEAVQIRDVRRCLDAYPHQLSGGQRQRVLIAIAVAQDPSVIVADEPTTALDVTVQAHIIELLSRLRRELGFALLLISHDLGLVARVADRIAVMYAGDIVETGPVSDVLAAPRHPYTRGLLESSRSLEEGRTRLAQIPGTVPAPRDFAAACRFAGRCPNADQLCRDERPQLMLAAPGRGAVACHHPLGAQADGPTPESEVAS